MNKNNIIYIVSDKLGGQLLLTCAIEGQPVTNIAAIISQLRNVTEMLEEEKNNKNAESDV